MFFFSFHYLITNLLGTCKFYSSIGIFLYDFGENLFDFHERFFYFSFVVTEESVLVWKLMHETDFIIWVRFWWSLYFLSGFTFLIVSFDFEEVFTKLEVMYIFPFWKYSFLKYMWFLYLASLETLLNLYMLSCLMKDERCLCLKKWGRTLSSSFLALLMRISSSPFQQR